MSKFQFFCELIEIGSAFDTPMSFRYRHQSLVPKIIFRKVSPEVDRQILKESGMCCKHTCIQAAIQAESDFTS